MTIIRTIHNRENPYVMLNKAVLEEKEMSWAAKGLWAYLIAKPDNWNISVPHLENTFGTPGKRGSNRDAIYSILNELIELGYCERFQKKENGKFLPTEYVVYEFKKSLPNTPQPDTVKPDNTKERSSFTSEANLKKETTTKEKQRVVVSASQKLEDNSSSSEDYNPDSEKSQVLISHIHEKFKIKPQKAKYWIKTYGRKFVSKQGEFVLKNVKNPKNMEALIQKQLTDNFLGYSET